MTKYRTNLSICVSIFITILVLTIIPIQIQSKGLIEKTTPFAINETSDYKMKIYDFSHYNLPIYVNYTTVNMQVEFETEETSLVDIELHYSPDGIIWETVEMIFDRELTDNSSIYQVTFGPFSEVGIYYVQVNATIGSTLLAQVSTQIIVEDVNGLVFVDFDYQISPLENGTQYINVQISVLGENLDNTTLQAIFNQPTDNETIVTMKEINGSILRFNATVGPVDEWDENVQIIFKANTTGGENYESAIFLFTKSPPIYPEDFWRQKFPAIAVGVFAVVAMGTIFIIARRKAPSTTDYEKEIKRSEKKQAKRKEKNRKKKKKEELEFD